MNQLQKLQREMLKPYPTGEIVFAADGELIICTGVYRQEVQRAKDTNKKSKKQVSHDQPHA